MKKVAYHNSAGDMRIDLQEMTTMQMAVLQIAILNHHEKIAASDEDEDYKDLIEKIKDCIVHGVNRK